MALGNLLLKPFGEMRIRPEGNSRNPNLTNAIKLGTRNFELPAILALTHKDSTKGILIIHPCGCVVNPVGNNPAEHFHCRRLFFASLERMETRFCSRLDTP